MQRFAEIISFSALYDCLRQKLTSHFTSLHHFTQALISLPLSSTSQLTSSTIVGQKESFVFSFKNLDSGLDSSKKKVDQVFLYLPMLFIFKNEHFKKWAKCLCSPLWGSVTLSKTSFLDMQYLFPIVWMSMNNFHVETFPKFLTDFLLFRLKVSYSNHFYT